MENKKHKNIDLITNLNGDVNHKYISIFLSQHGPFIFFKRVMDHYSEQNYGTCMPYCHVAVYKAIYNTQIYSEISKEYNSKGFITFLTELCPDFR